MKQRQPVLHKETFQMAESVSVLRVLLGRRAQDNTWPTEIEDKN